MTPCNRAVEKAKKAAETTTPPTRARPHARPPRYLWTEDDYVAVLPGFPAALEAMHRRAFGALPRGGGGGGGGLPPEPARRGVLVGLLEVGRPLSSA